MRKSFFTGLGIILPLVLTVLIVMFLINLLTKPFLGIAQGLLDYSGLLGKPILFLSSEQLVLITSKFLVLLSLFVFTLVIGFFARWVFVHYLIRIGDYIIHKIPVVNKIYKAIKDVVTTLFDSPNQTFSQVVLVPFPHTKGLALGFIVAEKLPDESDKEYSDLVSVFVPATPNPTMGFMLLYKRSQLHYLDMKIDEALKCIVSCGVLFAENGHKIAVASAKKGAPDVSA